jgi:hypothetical protein
MLRSNVIMTQIRANIVARPAWQLASTFRSRLGVQHCPVLSEFGRVTKAGSIRPENVTSRLHHSKTSRDIVQLMSAKRTQFAPDDLAGATLMPNSSTATVAN